MLAEEIIWVPEGGKYQGHSNPERRFGEFDIVSKIPFPLFGSPKEDGIRCTMVDTRPLTRSFKDIPNLYIRDVLSTYGVELNGFDGELRSGKTFQDTTSAIMSRNGEPDFTFKIFDYTGPGNYKTRYLERDKPQLPFVEEILQVVIYSMNELRNFFYYCLNLGYEGSCFRRGDGLDAYKYGRSTLAQAYLLKMPEYASDEMIVTGFIEEMYNGNVAEVDAFGHTKRSTSKAGKVGKGTLGSLVGVSAKFGEVQIGTLEGFDHEFRQYIWNNQPLFKNKILKYRYKPYGTLDKPRQPVGIGFRHENDM